MVSKCIITVNHILLCHVLLVFEHFFSKMASFFCNIASACTDSEPGCINIDPHEYGVMQKYVRTEVGLSGWVLIAYRGEGGGGVKAAAYLHLITLNFMQQLNINILAWNDSLIKRYANSVLCYLLFIKANCVRRWGRWGPGQCVRIVNRAEEESKCFECFQMLCGQRPSFLELDIYLKQCSSHKCTFLGSMYT